MRQAACIIVALVCFTLSPVAAQQVIEDYGDPMTTYLPSADTLVQGIHPTHAERAVHLDGTGRSAITVGARVAASPFRGVWGGTMQIGNVRLATGGYAPTDIDISLPADVPWIVGRSFNALQDSDSAGYQGVNWFQTSQPEILLYEHTNPSADPEKDVLYAHFGADRFVEFKRHDDASDEFKGRNGGAGSVQHAEGTTGEPDTYTLTDQNGTQFVYFGFDGDASPAEGQLWKIIDPSGNTAYVGDSSTGSTAISGGYDSGGRIETAYDSAGRRYSYTYNGDNRVTQVLAEVNDSGWVAVAKVEYSYYGPSEDYGEEGDLELVKTTDYLTDSGVTNVRRRYYRYYEGTYNVSSNPGTDHQLKYIFDSEALRRYDLDDDATLNDSYTDDSPGALESYASAYFEYNSDGTIREAWFNGECGCGGAGDGTYEFTYDENAQYSDTSGTYDTTWQTRTIVKRPDDSYLTQYFDEVGQPLHQIISDDDPSNTGPQPNLWITKVTRDSSGQVTQVSTPANVTSYTHSDSGSWAIGTSTTVGLVHIFDRETSGNMKGFLTKRKHAEGTSGTAYLDEKLTYTSESQTIGDVTVVRPLVSARRVYPVETTNESHADSEETTYAYTEYGSDPLAIEAVTTTHPAVSTSKNGSGSTTETKTHYTEEGQVDFEKSADGIITYREYTDGRLTKVIEDADTSSLSPPTGFASSGTELHQVTEYSYDTQGRQDEMTLPGGRVTKNYYSKLADGRRVHLSYPKYESGTPTFHGPVRYTVTNLAGKVEAQATVALSGNTTTSALTAHIDETDSDPILAADLGTVSALTTFVYGNTGAQLDEERLYYDIPASGAGADGTNYDPTLYAYDDSGRRWRTKHAHGTIYRTVYDLFGRQTERWMGRNDASFEDGEASGPDDMVKTQASEYDAGTDGGNGLLTERTLYVTDGTTDERVTEFEYDYRGRQLLVKNPTAPHTLNEYDNLGRMTATGQYSSHASISLPSDTPSSESTNRLALSKTFYDQMGRVWKRTRHKIDASDGSDDDNLESLTWFDEEGKVIKTDGQTLAKTFYDRVGRATHRFTLARDNDSGYSDADDVSGDIVMEESQTTYDDDGTVIMRAVVQRFHDDFGATPTTGALDTNADSDDLQYTAANLEGRIQITAMWYDDTGRLEDTVLYGTNGGSNFDRDALSVPTRSATKLRTTRVYHDSGQLKSVEDPREIVTYFEYDDAGRKTKEVRNYDASVNSGDPSGTDDNVTVKYEFVNGLRTKIIADMPSGTTDQETLYIYGTTDGTPSASEVTTGHLLRATVYPDSTNSGTTEANINSDDSDVVSFAYNAQGQQVYKKDQAGNVIETDFDDSGRTEHRRVSTLDADFDGAVRRISTTYDSLGRRELVTQYDNATVGSGSVVDEVKFTYESWGNVSKFEQDINSAVGAGGSVDDYEVSYTYAKAGTTGRNTIRLDEFTLPSGNVITCKYRGNTTDRHDTYLSRVTTLDDGATVLVAYEYLGMGRVVGTDYFAADLESDVHGTTSGSYPDLDDFNRITTNKWTRDLATDINFYEIDISYDENSNITLIEDTIHSGFDVDYTIDDLNRLTQAEEGTWGGSSITTTTREQEWTLDHVGNWDVGKLDLDGDGNYTGTDEWNDDRTHNDVNELTGRDTDDNGSDDFTLSYDENGNLTDDGEDYKYEWDPFGRLRKVLDRGDDSLVAEYKYNGLSYRISEHADTDDDGDVDSNDKWFHSAYNERWRLLSVFREDDGDPKEEYAHHLAGLDGRGAASYIDQLVIRWKDADTAWTVASDGSLEEQIYYCQNWKADVSVVVEQPGSGAQPVAVQLQEWVRYSAYGTPYGMPGGDTDSDGECDSADVTQVQAWIDATEYDLRGDVDLDGLLDGNDKADIQSGFEGVTLGRGAASHRGNRTCFSGLIWGVSWSLARERYLSNTLGRWISRDPLEGASDPNLIEYVRGSPIKFVDPLGLQSTSPAGTPLIDPGDCPAYDPTAESGPSVECWGRSFWLDIAHEVTARSPGNCVGPVSCSWTTSFGVKICEGSQSGPCQSTDRFGYLMWHGIGSILHPVNNQPESDYPSWDVQVENSCSGGSPGPDFSPHQGSSEPRLHSIPAEARCGCHVRWTITATSASSHTLIVASPFQPAPPVTGTHSECSISASITFNCGLCWAWPPLPF